MRLLTIAAFLVLGAAAVWLGGINQDEGWYLYAANLVADGQLPYRDFSYTQGPMLPFVYSVFTGVWKTWGLLGARIFTLTIGAIGILFAAALAHRLAPEGKKGVAAWTTFILLACNIYHLYYVAIPKTYALAGLFVILGFWLFFVALTSARVSFLLMVMSALALAFAAGTRISLGILLPVVGLNLLLQHKWKLLIGFCVGGFVGLLLVYGPFLCDHQARAGLLMAQRYHAARGGFDIVWTIGSFSRLVRWYLPIFVLLGIGIFQYLNKLTHPSSLIPYPSSLIPYPSYLILLLSFLSVFIVQMLAPFPYEDYQVPIMALLAIFATLTFLTPHPSSLIPHPTLLLPLLLTFATSFGSPLLEKWMTNGQDRFWSLKKEKCELAQLQDVARQINALDPNGKTLFTQDTYLAIETNRRVPKGLEMGPFAQLSDAAWRKLLTGTVPDSCAIAALSGYTFAIEAPVCNERPIDRQMEYWNLLKKNFTLAERVEAFGQNATPLLILKRK